MRKPPGPDFKQKRIDSKKLTIRDQNNNCRVGGIFKINNQTKMIILSSNKNIYLIDKKRKISKINIRNWKKKFRYEINNKEFASIWSESIYKRLDGIKKEEAKNKVKRTPTKKIIRKPVKKIIRRPAK
jgi:hypothetical protein